MASLWLPTLFMTLVSLLVPQALTQYTTWREIPDCAKYCLQHATEVFSISPSDPKWMSTCTSSYFYLSLPPCIHYNNTDGCGLYSRAVRDDIWYYISKYFCQEFNRAQHSSTTSTTASKSATSTHTHSKSLSSISTVSTLAASSSTHSSTSLTSSSSTTSSTPASTKASQTSILISTIVVDLVPTPTYPITTGIVTDEPEQNPDNLTTMANSSAISGGTRTITTELDFWYDRWNLTLGILVGFIMWYWPHQELRVFRG